MTYQLPLIMPWFGIVMFTCWHALCAGEEVHHTGSGNDTLDDPHNDTHHLHNASSLTRAAVMSIFAKYGQNGSLSFEGFEELLESLGLGKIHDDDDHSDDEHSEHDHSAHDDHSEDEHSDHDHSAHDDHSEDEHSHHDHSAHDDHSDDEHSHHNHSAHDDHSEDEHPRGDDADDDHDHDEHEHSALAANCTDCLSSMVK